MHQCRASYVEIGHAVAKGDNSFDVGANAAEQARTSIHHHSVCAALVFASVHYDLSEVLRGIAEVIGDAPIIGSTTAGEICDGMYRESVVVTLLASPYLCVQTGVGGGVSKDWRAAVDEALTVPTIRPYFHEPYARWQELSLQGKSAFALVFSPGNTHHSDCRSPQILEALKARSQYRMHFFGGSSADDWRMETNYVLYGRKAHPDSVLVAVFETQLRFGMGLGHGFRPISRRTTATKTAGHEVLALDGKPASDVYAALFDLPIEQLEGKHLTLTTGCPFGTFSLDGQYQMNVPSYFTRDAAIRFSLPVPEGTVFDVMEPDSASLAQGARIALQKALHRGAITEPGLVLVTSCALRSRLPGNPAAQAIPALVNAAPGAAVVGFECLGEQSVLDDGSNQHCNESIGVFALGNELTDAARVYIAHQQMLDESARSESALRDAKEEWEFTFDAVSDGIAILTDDFRIVRVNKALSSRLGFQPEECRGRLCYEVIHGTDAPPPDCPHAMLLRDGAEHTAEFAEARLRGEFLVTVAPILDAHGQRFASVHVMHEITERKRAETALRRRDAVLEAVSFAAEEFLRTADWEEPLVAVLERLGRAAEVSGVSVFRNYSGPQGALWTRQQFAWRAPRSGRHLPEVEAFPWEGGGMERWADTLSAGNAISGHVREFPLSEQEFLTAQVVHSVVAVPVFVQDTWWGFIGFEEHRHEREWTGMALEALFAAAGILGAAIQRRNIERALAEERERFHKLIEYSSDIWAVVSADGTGRYVSDSVERITGFTRDECVGQKVFPFLHPDDLASALEVFGELVMTPGAVRQATYRHRTKNGGWVILEAIATNRLDDPIIEGVVLNARNVTEQKAMEDALRRSENRLRLVANNISDVIWTMNLDGQFTYVTPSIEKLRGYSIAEIASHDLESMHTPESARIAKDMLTLLNNSDLESEFPRSLELEIMRKDGSAVWTELVVSLMRDANGIPVGVVGSTRNIDDRKRAEQRLAAEAMRRRLLVEQSRDGIVVLDQNGKVVEANRRYAEMLGYTPEEVLELHVWDWDLQFKPDALREMIRTVDASGDHFETRHRRKDGTWYDVEISTNGVMLEGQKYIFCVCRDISERKRSEEALRSSEERYHGIFDESVVAIFLFDREKRFIDSNQAGLNLLGYAREELLALRIPDVDADPMVVLSAHDDLLTGGRLFNYEHKLRRKDGSVITVLNNSRPLTGANGEVIGMLSTLLDITERKVAEEALRQSEMRSKAIREALPDLLFLINREGVLLDYHADDPRRLLLPPEQFLGLKFHDVLPEGLAKTTWEHIQDIARYGRTAPFEYELVLGDKTRSYESRMVACGEENFLCFVRDISDQKHAEKERENLQEQLLQAQKMEAVGQLAGGVAHDFNNLLQIMLGNLEIAKSQLAAEPEVRSTLNEVMRAAGHAADLTRQLLAFSRRQIIQPVHVDLDDLVANVLRMVRRVIGEHIELRYTTGRCRATVHADRGQAEQILINLCLNARDAMHAGGILAIELDEVILDSDFCRQYPWAEVGDYARLRVTDTGQGMDEATRERVFEPFFTTKDLGQGTGLGLATVYGIVRQHNGLITVESELGIGTTFTVYLPSAAPAAITKGSVRPVQVVGGTEVILVAEDEESVRKLITRMLESKGYTVLNATDGVEALRIYEENRDRIQLAILDVMMPRLGGRQVMDRIQAIDPDMRFLFSSGYSQDDIDVNFVVEKGLRLITKPYSRAELLRAVRGILDA